MPPANVASRDTKSVCNDALACRPLVNPMIENLSQSGVNLTCDCFRAACVTKQDHLPTHPLGLLTGRSDGDRPRRGLLQNVAPAGKPMLQLSRCHHDPITHWKAPRQTWYHRHLRMAASAPQDSQDLKTCWRQCSGGRDRLKGFAQGQNIVYVHDAEVDEEAPTPLMMCMRLKPTMQNGDGRSGNI